MRLSGIALAAAGAAVLAAGFAAWRPSAAAQQPKAGTLQVYSRLTVLDVTATDSSGRPIQGLKQSDFTITEDGNPQPIRNFEEVSSQYVEPPRVLPPNVYTNLEPPPPTEAVNILLLDFAHEAPKDSTDLKELPRATRVQHMVKQAAVEAIAKMPPGTRMALVSMTNSLHILEGFTSNKDILTAAINAAPYFLEGHGISGGDGAPRPPGMASTAQVGPSKNEATNVQRDMLNRMILESFQQIAADTANIHARKNLLWFTSGIPDVTDPNHDGAIPDYSKPLSEAYDVMAAARISVYPIGDGGVARLGPGILSMDMVAEATGGVAYYETNGLSAGILKALENGANYYSISYIPPGQKFDGVYHKIEVKVDRPGVILTYRKGYFGDDLSKHAMKPGLTLSMVPPSAEKGNMKAPMSRGMPTSQDLLFDVGVEPSTLAPKPGDPPILGTLDAKLLHKRLIRYGFQYVVPAEQIKFTPGSKNTHDGKIDFDIAVYDADDKLLTGLSQVVKTTLSDATYQKMLTDKEPIRLMQQIDLPVGQLFIRVGVLDEATDKVGTLELPLKVARN